MSCEKTCKEVVVPEVDNSELECGDCGNIKTTCVNIVGDYELLGLLDGDTLTKGLEKIDGKISELLIKISELEDRIALLEE